MSLRSVFPGRLLLVLAVLSTLSSVVLAQEATPPKADIFVGYNWTTPGRIFNDTPREGAHGFGAAITFNANRWAGFTVDAGGNTSEKFHFSHIMIGPRLMARTDHANFFAEALGGLARIAPGRGETRAFNGGGFLTGGGIDIPITRNVFFRLIQADYLWQKQHHTSYGLGTQKGAQLRTGFVFGLGGGEPTVPVAATCTAQPTAVMAGEPVTITTTAANFNPKHTVNYDFKSTGGKIAPKGNTATVDTTGLAPGQYSVTGTVTDPRAKKNNVASCNAAFTINEPPKHPPTISCSADKTTVRSGDPVTITCQGNSPDNRPLTYNWKCSGGRVTPKDATATLDTAGAPAGPISCTTTVSDDRGLTADATTTVTVEVPPPPPTASKLNEIAFPNKQKPWRVDNTAKAILDDVALRLQREADAKAVVVGYFDPAEVKAPRGRRKPAVDPGVALAQERAVNTKAYLTQEKGIDPSRIEVRTGTAGGNRAEIYLVPAGATFNVEGTTPFDESTVKPHTDRPARRGGRAAKKPAAQ